MPRPTEPAATPRGPGSSWRRRPRALWLAVAAACSRAAAPVVPAAPPSPAIVLEGTCDAQGEPIAFDPGTTIAVVACLGDEHPSASDAGIRVRDQTFHLVHRRGATILATEALGTWETGPEWGGYAELAGVLRAGPRGAVAVITIAEHDGPDDHAARAAVYRLTGERFTSIYAHPGTAAVAADRATVSDCVPSDRATPPGPCERLINARPRETELRWNGAAIVAREVPAP